MGLRVVEVKISALSLISKEHINIPCGIEPALYGKGRHALYGKGRHALYGKGRHALYGKGRDFFFWLKDGIRPFYKKYG